MIREIYGNAVDYTLESKHRVMIHCTNNQGVMGAGIAKEVKEKVYESYLYYKGGHKLGGVTGVGTQVLNLTAQERYGRGKRQVNYGALAKCLMEVGNNLSFQQTELVVPKYMACGLAGGNWEVVMEMIEYFLSNKFSIITTVEL